MKEIICFGEVSYQVNILQLKNRKKNIDNSTLKNFFPSTKKQMKHWQLKQYFNVVLKASL